MALIIAIVVLLGYLFSSTEPTAHKVRASWKIGLESNKLPSLKKEFTYLLNLLTIRWTGAGDCPCVHPLLNINISKTNWPIDIGKAALG